MSHPQTTGQSGLQILERYRNLIQTELRGSLEGREGPPYSLMRYHLGWEDTGGGRTESRGGKLIRPGLVLLCCEAVGGDPRSALPAAAAVELLHNFTLLHDDVEDTSEQRHGRDTAWRVWSTAEAINAGDGMFGLAHLTLLNLSNRGNSPEIVLAAARLLDEATVVLCEGQHRDLRYETQTDVSIDDYLAMIEGKTAALLAASCAIGALLGRPKDSAVRAFYEFGLHLGLAFQIRDDILGCWGDVSKTGKSSGDDIRAGKRSYPIVVGLEFASDEERRQLRSVLGRADASDEQVHVVRSLLEGLDAKESGERAAREHAEAAVEALGSLSLGDHRAELEELARFAAERNS